MKKLKISDHAKIPGPLYKIIKLYCEEENWFRKIHRIIDAFEWSIKWHTVLTLSDLLGDIPDAMKYELSEKLATPSLGIWYGWHLQALNGLKDPVVDWKGWDTLFAAENENGIIALRNKLAHGATPSEDQCQKECENFLPVLLDLISSPFFREIGLVLPKREGPRLCRGDQEISCSLDLEETHAGAVLLENPDKLLLDLWPLGYFQPSPDPKADESFFYFYNALRKKKVEQLNYENCLRRRDKELWDPFHRQIPLDKWGRQSLKAHDESRGRIADLTETFIGRSVELQKLGEFMKEGRGTLWVKGGPGFGKSALLAKASQKALARNGRGLELNAKVINYFIRRGSANSTVRDFLARLCALLDNQYDLEGLPDKGDLYDLRSAVGARLDAIEEHSEQPRLALILDGLDESEDIIPYIPPPRTWFCVICSGRPTKALKEFYDTLDPRKRYSLDVGKLGEDDVRALLMEVVDKYDDRFNEHYVRAVSERSEGNPLYLNLLCDELFENAQKLGDLDALPDGIEEILKGSVQRITDKGKDRDAFGLLNLLAVAKSSLSVPAISQFLGINSAEAQAAVDSCLELLVEADARSKHLEYQLFHEKLRDWVQANHGPECVQMEESLSEKCFAWRSLKTTQAKTYALQFGAEHLYDRKDHDKLWDLLRDEDFQQCQVEEFDENQTSRDAYRLGLKLYVERNGLSKTDDARLSWLALRAGDLAQCSLLAVSAFLENLHELGAGDPSRLDMCLEKLEILGQKHLVEASLLLLWNEMNLKDNWESGEPYPFPDAAQRIIDFVNDKIDHDTVESKWNHYRSESYMHAFCKRLKHAFPQASMVGFLGITQENQNAWHHETSPVAEVPSNFFLDPQQLLDRQPLGSMLGRKLPSKAEDLVNESLQCNSEDGGSHLANKKLELAYQEVLLIDEDFERQMSLEILASTAAERKNLSFLAKLYLEQKDFLQPQPRVLIRRFIAKNENPSRLIGDDSFCEICEDPRALVLLCENLLKTGDEINAEKAYEKLLNRSRKFCDHADVMPIVSSLVFSRKYLWAAEYLLKLHDPFDSYEFHLNLAWNYLHENLLNGNDLQAASSVAKLELSHREPENHFDRFKLLCQDFERVLGNLNSTRTTQFLNELINCAGKLQEIRASQSSEGDRQAIDCSVECILRLSEKLNEFPDFGKLLEFLVEIAGQFEIKFKVAYAGLVYKETIGDRDVLLKALGDYRQLPSKYYDSIATRCECSLRVSEIWARIARNSEGDESKKALVASKKFLCQSIDWAIDRMQTDNNYRLVCMIIKALRSKYFNVLDESSCWEEYQGSLKQNEQTIFRPYEWKGESNFFHRGDPHTHILHILSESPLYSWHEGDEQFKCTASIALSFLGAAYANICKKTSMEMLAESKTCLLQIVEPKDPNLIILKSFQKYLLKLIDSGQTRKATEEKIEYEELRHTVSDRHIKTVTLHMPKDAKKADIENFWKKFDQNQDREMHEFQRKFKLKLAVHRVNFEGTDPCAELSGLIVPFLSPVSDCTGNALYLQWSSKLGFVNSSIDVFLKPLVRPADFSSITLSDNLPVDELQPHELARLYLKCIKGSCALKSTEDCLSLTRKVIDLCLEGKVPKDYIAEVLGELTDLLPRGETFLPYLRNIMLADPLDKELSKEVVQAMVTSHLVMDNREKHAAIANECPAIGMSFLVTAKG